MIWLVLLVLAVAWTYRIAVNRGRSGWWALWAVAFGWIGLVGVAICLRKREQS